MEAHHAPFDPVNAQLALMDLWEAVRSKPKDQESVNMRLPLFPSTETAITPAVTASTELTDTTLSSCISPIFATNAVHHLFNHSEIDNQLLVLSISKEFARQVLTPFAWSNDNADRQLVALSVPTEVAKQLLFISEFTKSSQKASDSSSLVGADSAYPVLPVPYFTETEIETAHQLLALSNSNRLASSSPVLTENDCLWQIVKLFESSGPPRIMPITSVFSHAELATAVKLLEILDSSNKELLAAISRSNNNEKEILMAHSLLDRFAFQNRQELATTEFSSDDIIAAHQLRALFVSEDAKRRIGPIFLVFPDAEITLRLVPLSNSDDAACLLLERSID